MLFGIQTARAVPVGFEVCYIASYAQTGPTSVALVDGDPYQFGAYAVEDSETSVFSAGLIVTPLGVSSAMEQDSDALDWDQVGDYASLADCTKSRPSGTYTMKLTKVSGGTVQIAFSVNAVTLPVAPRVQNYAALQSINPSKDLVVSWDVFSGATSSDAVTIDVFEEQGDLVFTMGHGYHNDEFIPGTSNSVTIPAGTLMANATYEMDVAFYKLSGYSSSGAVADYPEATRVVSFGSTTSLPIATSESVNESIFSSLSHKGEWVVPEDSNVAASFGWVNDATYPWVYSIAADTIANGGKYAASGKGWMYVLPDGASLDGFYFYSYATDSWCWANFSWSGWVYDYKTGKWVDFTPAK
jgi:hypothetical protein